MREIEIVRRLAVCGAIAALASLSGAAAALASVVGTTTTSTGQTLAVTIDTPADGYVSSSPYVNMNGTDSLSAARPGHPSVRITAIRLTEDGGVVETLDPVSSWGITYSAWGPRVLGATVVASDGSQATATINVTFPPQPTNLTAQALVVDTNNNPPSANDPMSAQLSVNGGKALAYVSGQQIDFVVGGQVVCTATTDSAGTATCTNSAANQSAVTAGGYDAVYNGSPYYAANSAHGDVAYVFGAGA